MKQFQNVSVCCAAFAALVLAGCVRDEPNRLPLAFAGDPGPVKALKMDVTVPARIVTENRTASWLSARDYTNYAAVVISGNLSAQAKASKLWLEPGETARAADYVAKGGLILITGWGVRTLLDRNPDAADLIGFPSVHGGPAKAGNVHLAGETRPCLWQDGLSCFAEKLRPGTETLATADFEGGRKVIVATSRQYGLGRVVWCSVDCGFFDMRLSALKRPLGEADAKGEYVPTDYGDSLRRFRRFITATILSASRLDCSAPANDWGLVPLGGKGNLPTAAAFRTKPTYRRMPVFRPGLVFRSGTVRGVVRAPRGDRRLTALGDELAWHLSEMCGAKVPLASELPKDPSVPVIDIDPAAAAGVPYGTSVIRRDGRRLVVSGRGAGVSFAVTYLLESLGCRYLWPGKSGKIIPKRAEIVLPELDWTYAPAMKFREMRQFWPGYSHDRVSLKDFWGIDDAAFKPVFESARFDRRGNRDFLAWHGVNDENDLPGKWRWGHYFGDYWQKYGKDHLDWFALQPNGSRVQELQNRPERPCLCTSNPGLVEQAAKDAIAAFDATKDLRSFSICLPDGGPTTPCMCSGCRRLDPENGAPVGFYVGGPWWQRFPYVSFTDRIMTFNNGIAERLAKVHPDARLGVYVYSNYESPAVRVKPHPALVLLTVAGSFSKTGHEKTLENLAYWSQYDNMLLWRPNVFFPYTMSMPQNYARTIFEDMELFKLNRVVGTDFDCMNAQYATRGLIWYMVAKAHRNPDSVGYDDLVDDYCRAGFGAAAADVRRYFDALEEMTRSVAGRDGSSHDYAAAFDPVRLGKILAAADASAAGDADVRARIAYLRRGVETGAIEKRLSAAWVAKDRKGVLAAQEELRANMTKNAFEEPWALNPIWMTGTYHSPHMKKPNF